MIIQQCIFAGGIINRLQIERLADQSGSRKYCQNYVYFCTYPQRNAMFVCVCGCVRGWCWGNSNILRSSYVYFYYLLSVFHFTINTTERHTFGKLCEITKHPLPVLPFWVRGSWHTRVIIWWHSRREPVHLEVKSIVCMYCPFHT